jgi:hypothetical protein
MAGHLRHAGLIGHDGHTPRARGARRQDEELIHMTMNTEQVADALTAAGTPIDQRTLRKALRAAFKESGAVTPGKGARYSFTEADLPALVKLVQGWQGTRTRSVSAVLVRFQPDGTVTRESETPGSESPAAAPAPAARKGSSK